MSLIKDVACLIRIRLKPGSIFFIPCSNSDLDWRLGARVGYAEVDSVQRHKLNAQFPFGLGNRYPFSDFVVVIHTCIYSLIVSFVGSVHKRRDDYCNWLHQAFD
jgi:hypothetical protein